MEGTYTTHVCFHVRTVSLRQLAALWSTVMAMAPEVRSGSATFERRGQPTEHEYVYRDADELAHAGLEVAPGELRLRSIRVHGPETSVGIHERAGTDFLSAVLVLPNALCVDIAGSNERDVLKIRNAVEHWGMLNLATTRQAVWLKLGVLAAGIVGIWAGAAVLGFPANDAIAATVLWVPGVTRRASVSIAWKSSRAPSPIRRSASALTSAVSVVSSPPFSPARPTRPLPTAHHTSGC